MKGKLWLVVLAAGLMVVLQACGIIGGGSNSGGQVNTSISPTSANLQPGGTEQFTATVTGTSNTAVTWKVSGGQVNGSGNTVTYTAPVDPGTYSVTATSQADKTKYASATVVVSNVGALPSDPTYDPLADQRNLPIVGSITSPSACR